jgi:predicted DNA-binding WGR domain protein
MRIFFFIRRNPALNIGVSSKMWKIERSGRQLQVWWGRAKFNEKTRRPEPEYGLLTKIWRFSSPEEAIANMKKRIDSKRKEGYEQTPRSRKRANAAN